MLGWLPDLKRWAEVAARFVRPGGILYVASISNFISVYGLKKSTPTLQNFALNHQATGSEPCDPSQTPEKAFNGSTEGGRSDKWCSSAASPFLRGAPPRNSGVLRRSVQDGEEFRLCTSKQSPNRDRA